jgi:hypothetical protein
MTKQLSIASLQQELAHLENWRGEHLLVKIRALESFKQKLPDKSDQVIIDWAVSKLMAKMKEGENLYKTSRDEFDEHHLSKIKKLNDDSLFDFLKSLSDESCAMEHALDKGEAFLQEFFSKAVNAYIENPVLTEAEAKWLQTCSIYFEDRAKESNSYEPDILISLAHKLKEACC